MRFLPVDRRPTVAVVGFGYVGSCVAATLAQRGLRVLGIDRDQGLVEEMRNGHCRFNEPDLSAMLGSAYGSGRLTLDTEYETVRDADVVVITVGTPIGSQNSVVTEELETVCRALAGRLQPEQLVIVKSTVAPGMTNRLVKPLLEKSGLVQGEDFGLAFCPERLSEGSAIAQLATLPMVVGGCDEVSADAACAFWRDVLGIETLRFCNAEVAELVKLADNWWIDTNIAMANELAQLCKPLGIDVLDVISGANSLPKGHGQVNFLLPSVGVGGSCLTKDPWILWNAGREQGVRLRTVEVAREINQAMPQYTFQLISDELAALGKRVDGAKLAILGLAFKNNTNDLRNTPVRPVVDALRAAGAQVALHDPLVDADATLTEFGSEQSCLQEAVQDADCIAILAGHDCFRALDFADTARRAAMPSVIVDGRMYYPRETVDRLRSLGFTYRGIGR